MKIDNDENNGLRLKEVYTGVTFETDEGNQMSVCMRDDTLEINIMPEGVNTSNWWRVNMQTGVIEQMGRPLEQ